MTTPRAEDGSCLGLPSGAAQGMSHCYCWQNDPRRTPDHVHKCIATVPTPMHADTVA